VGLSTTHVHHLFRRWCGLTPKAFLHAITLDNAKALLADAASVLDAAYEVGLSGPGRLHDLFVTHEAMTPGDYKAGGAGLALRFGFHPSPFGEAILVATERGLAGRIFDPKTWAADRPLRVVLIGTDFEVRVWQTLLRIPLGKATTYSDIACRLGKASASRAVGAAVGKNPISFVVPCHRVLGRSGALTGYHWGLTRKQAILGWEAGKLAS
jgi:AraC family transcriptional regulator of adaptative response/methylated-DNA-[protein]-cysteine methyltransferase